MSKTVILPNPDASTTINASLFFQRVAAGAAGVNINYDPANGDSSFQMTAAGLTAGSRTALATILAEVDAAMKTARGYT